MSLPVSRNSITSAELNGFLFLDTYTVDASVGNWTLNQGVLGLFEVSVRLDGSASLSDGINSFSNDRWVVGLLDGRNLWSFQFSGSGAVNITVKQLGT